MILFLQSIVVAVALFIVLISIREEKIPKGIIEWLFIIDAFILIIIWVVKFMGEYCEENT